MARKSSRDAILDAAERVVMRNGLKGTTVDAVAVEAGVSKGGLFYHFASKQEMLQRVIDRHVEKYLELRDKIILELPDSKSRKLRAMLQAFFSEPMRHKDSLSNILALLDDATLREKIYLLKKKMFEEMSQDTARPEQAALAMMAVDGLWMSNMYGAPLFSEELMKKVMDELLRIIDDFCHSA